MKKTTKFLMIGLSLILVFSMFTACGNGDDGGTTPGNDDGAATGDDRLRGPAVNRDTIIIATDAEHDTFHAFTNSFVATINMNVLTYDALLCADPDDFTVRPRLVREWENIEDTVWQFTLAEGIRFHNGEIMTTADVKASIEYAMTFPAMALQMSLVEEVVIIDELTFQIITPDPTFLLPEFMATHAFMVKPKSLIEAGHDFDTDPIGSGPFRLIQHIPGERVIFEAFEYYFYEARRPSIRHMEWVVIPEEATRTIALETGEVDVLQVVSASDMARLQANPNVTVHTKPGTTFLFLSLNIEKTHAYLHLPEVRQAIDMALWKEDNMQAVVFGHGLVTYHQVHEVLPGTSSRYINHFDPDYARGLLESVGLQPGDVYFKINVANDPGRRNAEIMQAALREIGINVSIEQTDLPTFMAYTTGPDYYASISSYGVSNSVMFLFNAFHSSQIDALNKSRLSDPFLDDLIERALRTADRDYAMALAEEASAWLNRYTMQVPLWLIDVRRATKADLVLPEIARDRGVAGGSWFETAYWR